ncbi:hypothetical protein CARUB_v10022475mg [Capsella rubella]|uniref:Uncharacterized protein n=3 Tax=Capsella rubella TaxID=81985 RepID=R0GGA9_9BRAS|nr:hypothetical protein CARUB_v10022475mg [Capsella rubella]
MRESRFEYLWKGTLPLRNLKKMDLLGSENLKELPDLSKATKLETLQLSKCRNLQIIPSHMNLVSLVSVSMIGCIRLRDIPVMSTNIEALYITETAIEDEPPSVRLCSRLQTLNLSRSVKLTSLTHLPMTITYLDVRYTGIKKIPDCIKALHELQFLLISSCRRLTSLPELPGSLQFLHADDCDSLVTIFSPLNITPSAWRLEFTNCFKLDQQARKAIIQQSFSQGITLLPGRQVPAEFEHRAKGNCLTIRSNGNDPLYALSRYNVCVVISPPRQEYSLGHSPPRLLCRHIAKGDLYPNEVSIFVGDVPKFRREHLFIFSINHRWPCIVDPSDVNREIVFEFSSEFQEFDIIECGAQILTDEWDYEFGLYQDDIEFESSEASGDDIEFESSEASEDEMEFESIQASEDDDEHGDSKEDEYLRTDCWSWLFLCFKQ